MEAGMNVARLNFSHGSHEEHGARIKNIREASKKTGKTVAYSYLIQKVQKSVHMTIEDGQAELVTGAEVILSMTEVLGTAEKFSVYI